MVVSWSASDRSSGPRSLAVWESEQTSRRWGGTEKRTQRRRDLLQHATCSKHCHLPTLPHQLQNVSRMSIVNPSAPRSPTIPARPPYQIDGLPGFLGRLDRTSTAPQTPSTSPSSRTRRTEKDETIKSRHQTGLPSPTPQNAPFSFVPSVVRVDSKTTQPAVAIRARLQRTRRAEANAKSLRLANPTPSPLRHLHHAPPPRVVRLPVPLASLQRCIQGMP